MITFCAARLTFVALLAALAAGCSPEQQDWRSAEAANTSEAYTRFLEQHADSELATQARTHIQQLQEERDWGNADGTATIEAYRHFLAQHPTGKWAEEARIRIEGFSLGSAPRSARQAQIPANRSGVRALQMATGVVATPALTPSAPVAQAAAASAEVATPDPGDVAQPAPASEENTVASALKSSDGYGVQFGAFGSQASADREWQRLQGRFGPQLSGLAPRIVVASTTGGQLYRLQAPAGGEAQARALCDALKEQSQACVPVIPR
jgi:cell division protein FtsN